MSVDTVSDKNSLIINGETYSLSVAPSYEDSLVKHEVESVLGQLTLSDITDNLYLSVELFYVAYNGVAGAKGGAIQADIAKMQSKLALLCNECVKTMTDFSAETENIIRELLQTYKWLTKGHEALAIKKLVHCSESSMRMSKSAHALAEGFRELQVNATGARAATIEQEASEHDRLLAAEKAEREIIAKQKAEKANQEELVSQISEMTTLYDEAKQREEKAAEKAMIMGITSAVAGALGAGLGAFAAAKNPIGTAVNSVAASNNDAANNAQMAESRRETDEKRRASAEAQQQLLAAKDEQTAKQQLVDQLKSDIAALNKKLSDLQQASSTTEDDLKEPTQQRDSKQAELKAAETELATATNKVKTLEKTAKDRTAEFAAAGEALQSMAASTNQMAQSAATAEESIHQEKMKYLNQKLELEQQKRQSLVALAAYAENVKNLDVEEGMAKISMNSLHAAVEALGKIIGTLTNASLFWDQMTAYCERMSQQGFQQDIKDLTDPDSGLSVEERVAEYRTHDFMSTFLKYLCQWVAVNGLSGEYLIAASNSQKKAVEYLSKSPTIEEALHKAPELARNMEVMIGQSLTKSRLASVELEQQKALIEQKQSATSA